MLNPWRVNVTNQIALINRRINRRLEALRKDLISNTDHLSALEERVTALSPEPELPTHDAFVDCFNQFATQDLGRESSANEGRTPPSNAPRPENSADLSDLTLTELTGKAWSAGERWGRTELLDELEKLITGPVHMDATSYLPVLKRMLRSFIDKHRQGAEDA